MVSVPVTTKKATSATAPTPATAPVSSSVTDYVNQTYPAFAGLMAIPDIANLMTLAQAQNWTSTQLQAELYNTDWWKQTPESARTWQIKKLTDPASAAQQNLLTSNQIAALAQGMGIGITHPQITWLSEEANANGWDATTMKAHVESLESQDKLNAGSITATQTSLRGIASQYGVPLSDATTLGWARNIAAGNTDAASFTEYAKNQAKISHPYWQKQLDEGLTTSQLADPYIQSASKLLEIPPAQIDLSDPKWNFTTAGKDGTQTPMNQLDWQKKVMTDPAYGWDHTQNAQDSAIQVSNAIRTSFGAM